MNILIYEKEVKDIVDYCGNISLSTSLGTLGASLDFDLAINRDDKNYSYVNDITVGNFVKVLNSKEIFSGIVVEVDEKKFSKTIRCLDYYFYLNNNKVIIQFYNVNATEAIKGLLKHIGINDIGKMENISTGITKIYKNNSVAEIIEDILKQVNQELGIKYLLEIVDGEFILEKSKKITVQAKNNIYGVPNIKKSITSMKNCIKVISNEQETTSIYAEIKDKESINLYGQLQEIIEVDPDKDISKVRNIAATKLKELNKIATSANLDIKGHDDIKAGRLLEIELPYYNLIGKFLIKSCNHRFSKSNHICSVELEVI